MTLTAIHYYKTNPSLIQIFSNSWSIVVVVVPGHLYSLANIYQKVKFYIPARLAINTDWLRVHLVTFFYETHLL